MFSDKNRIALLCCIIVFFFFITETSAYTSIVVLMSECPIVYTEQITSVVNKCIISFSPAESEYSYRRLTGFIQNVSEEDDRTELSEKNYSEIYRRYDQEKQFLSMIRNGDTKNVMSAFEKLSGPESLSDFSKETLNYYASGYGLAILKNYGMTSTEFRRNA